MRITLDAETFKALASPTRLTVLRALDERRKTLTEISRDLALNKATVHEHLALLTAADLVKKRDDEGRKWIYYELTWRGQKLLHPQETTTFNVLLGLGVAAAGGGIGLLARSLYTALEPHVEPASTPFADPEAMQKTNIAASEPTGGDTASDTGTHAPQAGAPAAGAGTTSSPQTVQDTAATSTAAAPQATDSSHAGLLDDGGALGLALLGFAALMALLAWLLRRHLRADPFQPPNRPEDA